MKIVELKIVEKLDEHGKPDNLDYRDMLITIMRTPLDLSRGMAVDEMRKCVRVLDILETAKPGATIEMEDADHEFMKQRVEGGRYMRADKTLLDFIDEIIHAQAKARDKTPTS